MQHLTGSSMELFFLSVLHTLVKKHVYLKILPMDIFEAFGRYESHF